MQFLSVVIPAYNEEKRITTTLEKIYNFLLTKAYDYEVIIVDDGSTDKTADVVKGSKLFKDNKLKVLKNDTNKGKGFSVKTGIINSTGDFVLFSDADLSTPIEELDNLLDLVHRGYDIIIGSRGLKESRVMVHQPIYREIMGKVFNFFVKSMLVNKFYDTQCGFKLFKGAVIRDIASNLKIDGFAFDVEILYVALKKGYKIKEAPVAWLNSYHSTVNPLCEPFKMFRDLFLIKVMHFADKFE